MIGTHDNSRTLWNRKPHKVFDHPDSAVPEDASGEEDQVDVVKVQGEGEDHHAEEGEAVDNQSGHPVKQRR